MTSKRQCFRQAGFFVDPSQEMRDRDALERIYNALIGESIVGNDPRDLPREQLQNRALDNMVALFRSIMINKVYFETEGVRIWDVAARQVGLHDGQSLSGLDAIDLFQFMAVARQNYLARARVTGRDWTPTSGLAAELVALVEEFIALAAEEAANRPSA